MENKDTYSIPKQPQRREFLRRLTMLVGASSAAHLLAGNNLVVAMDFHQVNADSDHTDRLFDNQQRAVLYALCDSVLPRTDTPSATEVGCHTFVEHQLQHCHTEQKQRDCSNILNAIEKVSMEQSKKSYSMLSSQKQREILVSLENQDGFTKEHKHQFRFLKSLLIFGYFTSEAGATQALNFQAVPGGFKGSIPYGKDSKAWGSLDYY